jgi:hypothetical protein
MSHLFDANPLGKQFGSDSFGRLRVSEPFTLGDYKHLYAIDPDFINVNVGTSATISYDMNQAAAILASGISTNGYTIHQTKRYHHYMPGKSQLIFSSFNYGDYQTNVTKRTGYFDDYNGIFFEQVGISTGVGTLNFVIRSNTSGIVSERRIPQESWNIDTLNGNPQTNPTGFVLDITKVQLFMTDLEWLGVGRVRCGFSMNGKGILAHEFYNSNILESVYMSNPNLPVRCEIRNTGTQVGAGGSFIQICSTVMSEGGYAEAGHDWSHTTGLRTIGIGSTQVPVFALRLKNSYKGYPNRATVKIRSLSVFTANENILYELVKIPNSVGLNTVGSTWQSESDNSVCEKTTNANSINGYYEDFLGGFSAASSQNNQKSIATSDQANAGPGAKKNFLTQNFSSTDSEIFAVLITNLSTATTSVGISIQWSEIY